MTQVLIPARGELAGRAIPEWRGKTANSAVPDRVRLRISLRYSRKDALTGEPLRKGWHIDHATALKDWIATEQYPHGNVEHNMQPVNAEVNTAKAAQENRDRKKVTKLQSKSLNITRPKTKITSRPFQSRLKPNDKSTRQTEGQSKHIAAMLVRGKRVPPPRFS